VCRKVRLLLLAAAAQQRVERDPRPEDEQPGQCAEREHDHGCESHGPLERHVERPGDERDESYRDDERGGDERSPHAPRLSFLAMTEVDYSSGGDYAIEFLGHEFSFNARDFEQRVTAAAVKLRVIEDNDLDEDETADLVELAADGRIAEPRSGLGCYLRRHWEQVSLVGGESLVYRLRKLVFRGAWLDHRVKEGLLDVAWDDGSADFGYRDPDGGRALLELAPVPSWQAYQFRR
jgi:hypothetical protein